MVCTQVLPRGFRDEHATDSELCIALLPAALNWSAGTKFGPPENYFTLRSQGGPYSSIQGTRTTDVKVGSPPRPPVFQYSYNPKRSDTGGGDEKKSGGGGGDKKAGGRRLTQSEFGFGPCADGASAMDGALDRFVQ